ncbi:permease (plasmid) [Gemmatirosa kalamazoonensis]|uniref:Permease n=1 Tax=Gemmatirosa kalamazoonensis TaxID=861299 RepID=W0RRZ4_9BACT|nr:ABC transporter permease [Gemmatirosa kalamazoonensis]AHG93739.1 permease [Gemmatirosa kalamazoonensis]
MRDPDIRPGVRRLFRLAKLPNDSAAEMNDEIRLHLALRTEQLVREGMSPEAARAEAERRFGDVQDAERLRASAAWRDGRLRLRERAESAWRTLRLAARALARTPGFVAVAVTCIALGVGANAAAFSLFDALVRRPLPVPEPDRLVSLSAPGPQHGSTQCNAIGTCEDVFSYPMFRDLQRGQTAFTGIAAHRLFIASVAVDGRATDGAGVLVSGSYFPVLRLRPALGRLLSPDDDRVPGDGFVAVLSHDYWTTHLGADPDVVGKRMVVNDKSLTIVGVAPRGFEGTVLGVRPRVFVPMTLGSELDLGWGSHATFDDRMQHGIFLFARLRPGMTIDGARAAMRPLYRRILAESDAPLQRGMSQPTMRRFLTRDLGIADGRRGQSMLRGATGAPLTFLFGITALVVLITCANLANLLLARGAGREAEVAVRLSLGARRAQVVTQLLVESCLLAALGGIASLLVARGTLAAAASFVPPPSLGSGSELSFALHPAAMAFAAAVSLGTALLFGLYPALHATRPDLIASIRSGAGQIAGGHRRAARVRTALVTTQIALSTALLVSAGLFVKSLRNVGHVDLGLRADGVVTFALVPALSGYSLTRSAAILSRVEADLRALPGVTGVGSTSVPMLTGMSNGGNVRVQGFRRGPDTDANTRMAAVSPGYLESLGIPLLAGREFTSADREGAPRVAMVNEAFARKFGLGRDVVGKRLAFDATSPEGALDVEIVGLIRDVRYSDVKREIAPLVLSPWRQDSTTVGLGYYVRTSTPEATLRAIPRVVAAIDGNLAVSMLKTLPQQVRENVYLDRMIGVLSAAFAALATLLAAVGLYGVLAYTVARRTREIGVRMALGAGASRVRGLVLGQVGRMTLVGGGLGVLGALGIGRATESLLFGLDGHDPTVIAVAAATIAAVALGAGYVPAWRASRVNPVGALRSD